MVDNTAIRVISLETAASLPRRSQFQKMADGANLAWDFYPAFSGPAPPITYNDEQSKLNHGRSLLPSEIGCYTSHFKLWEWLANSEFEQAIIFEDDTMIDWAAIGKLVGINFSEIGIDVLRLYSVEVPKVKSVKSYFLSGKYHLYAAIGSVWGTQGYIISRAAAARLVARYPKIEMPIDWVLTRYWEHHLINFLLFPSPLLERDISSTIGFHRHSQDRRGLFGRTGKLCRFLNKANVRLRRAYFDFRLFPKLTDLAMNLLQSENQE